MWWSKRDSSSYKPLASITQVTHDISHLTFADFLNGVGKETEVVARLSTVTHEKG